MSSDAEPKEPAACCPSIEQTYGMPVEPDEQHKEQVAILEAEHGLGEDDAVGDGVGEASGRRAKPPRLLDAVRDAL